MEIGGESFIVVGLSMEGAYWSLENQQEGLQYTEDLSKGLGDCVFTWVKKETKMQVEGTLILPMYLHNSRTKLLFNAEIFAGTKTTPEAWY